MIPNEPRYTPLNPDANVELLWKTLARVRDASVYNTRKMAGPVWDQETWAHGYITIAEEKTNWCRTSFCFAGWSTHLDDEAMNVVDSVKPRGTGEIAMLTNIVKVPQKYKDEVLLRHFTIIEEEEDYDYEEDEETLSIVDDNGNVVPVESSDILVYVHSWARFRLGLTPREATCLFHSDNQLEDIEKIVRVITGYTDPMSGEDVNDWKNMLTKNIPYPYRNIS